MMLFLCVLWLPNSEFSKMLVCGIFTLPIYVGVGMFYISGLGFVIRNSSRRSAGGVVSLPLYLDLAHIDNIEQVAKGELLKPQFEDFEFISFFFSPMILFGTSGFLMFWLHISLLLHVLSFM